MSDTEDGATHVGELRAFRNELSTLHLRPHWSIQAFRDKYLAGREELEDRLAILLDGIAFTEGVKFIEKTPADADAAAFLCEVRIASQDFDGCRDPIAKLIRDTLFEKFFLKCRELGSPWRLKGWRVRTSVEITDAFINLSAFVEKRKSPRSIEEIHAEFDS